MVRAEVFQIPRSFPMFHDGLAKGVLAGGSSSDYDTIPEPRISRLNLGGLRAKRRLKEKEMPRRDSHTSLFESLQVHKSVHTQAREGWCRNGAREVLYNARTGLGSTESRRVKYVFLRVLCRCRAEAGRMPALPGLYLSSLFDKRRKSVPREVRNACQVAAGMLSVPAEAVATFATWSLEDLLTASSGLGCVK